MRVRAHRTPIVRVSPERVVRGDDPLQVQLTQIGASNQALQLVAAPARITC
jgi:hypothetical protein